MNHSSKMTLRTRGKKKKSHLRKCVQQYSLLCRASPHEVLHSMKGEAVVKPRELLPSLDQHYTHREAVLHPTVTAGFLPTSQLTKLRKSLLSCPTVRQGEVRHNHNRIPCRKTRHQRKLNWYFRHDQIHILVSQIKILLQNNGLLLVAQCRSLYT